MPKLTQVQQAQRRAHILDAAEVCFARAGFHRTTMQDICRQANVSAGAVYLYFSSKEALIDGIVGRDREDIAALMRKVADAPDLFTGLQDLMRTAVIERPVHKAALYIEMIAEASRNPEVARAVSGCETGLCAALMDMLRTAQIAGRASPQIDPETTARLLLVMGDGLFVMMTRNRDVAINSLVPGLLGMIGQYLTAPDGAYLASSVHPTRVLAGVAE